MDIFSHDGLTLNAIPGSRLSTAFARRWRVNRLGGTKARLSRWRSWHWVLLQKLGVHRWVDARLFFGERMWILTGETVSCGLLSFGYAEAALTALMLEVIKPGMRVVDVGAHLGYEAILASALVGNSGRVVSFEPQPHIAVWTARNLEPFPQCRLVESAVGESCGELEFFEMDILLSAFSSANMKTATGRKIRVPVTTLGAAIREDERPVDFLKCDVEGGEAAVLRGAEALLRSDQPLLVLEAAMPDHVGRHARIKEFSEFLAPLGYVGFNFEYDGRLRFGRIGDFDVSHANVGFAPLSRPEFRLLHSV